MPFKSKANTHLDEDLCSIEAEAPSQARRPEDFGLWVGTWFGAAEVPLPKDNGAAPISVSFALRACKLRVTTCDHSRISQQGRYERVDHSITHTSKEGSESKDTGKTDVGGGLSLPAWVPGLTGKATAQRATADGQSSNASSEATHEEKLYGVSTTGRSTWKIEAVKPHQPILKRNELRDDSGDNGMLCYVETPGGAAEVTVTVSINHRDIVPMVAEKPDRLAAPELRHNQNAIAAILFNRSLERREDVETLTYEEGEETIIARTTLVRTPDEDNDGD